MKFLDIQLITGNYWEMLISQVTFGMYHLLTESEVITEKSQTEALMY